jgi:hypothetical protein
MQIYHPLEIVSISNTEWIDSYVRYTQTHLQGKEVHVHQVVQLTPKNGHEPLYYKDHNYNNKFPSTADHCFVFLSF